MCFNLVYIGCYGAREVNQLGLLICNKQADVWPSLHSHRKITMHTCCYTASIKRILRTEHIGREWNFAYFFQLEPLCNAMQWFVLKNKIEKLSGKFNRCCYHLKQKQFYATNRCICVCIVKKKQIAHLKDPQNVSHVTFHQIRINGYFLVPGKKKCLFEEKKHSKELNRTKRMVFLCVRMQSRDK